MRLWSSTCRDLPCVSHSLLTAKAGKVSASQGLSTWPLQRCTLSHHSLSHPRAVPPLSITGTGHGSSPACPQPISSSRTSMEIALTLAEGRTQHEHQVPAQRHKERKRKVSVVCKGSWFGQESGGRRQDGQVLFSTELHSLLLPGCSSTAGCVMEPCCCKSQLCFFPT